MEVDDHVCVGYHSVSRDVLDFFFRKDEDGVGTGCARLRIALRLVAEFLSKCVHLDVLCDGVPRQLLIAGDELSRRWMSDWGAEVFYVWWELLQWPEFVGREGGHAIVPCCSRHGI